MEFYERIRALREDTDTKQATIANLIGVGQSYYSKQERGEKPFRVEQVIQICQHYGVSADYVLGLPRGLPWPKH